MARGAAQNLAKRGVGVKVVNLPWLNRVDQDWLHDVVADYSVIATLDNHYVAGGQGEFLLSRIAQLGLSGKRRILQFGIHKVPLCGTNDEVLQAHRLDAENLAKQISSVAAGNER